MLLAYLIPQRSDLHGAGSIWGKIGKISGGRVPHSHCSYQVGEYVLRRNVLIPDESRKRAHKQDLGWGPRATLPSRHPNLNSPPQICASWNQYLLSAQQIHCMHVLSCSSMYGNGMLLCMCVFCYVSSNLDLRFCVSAVF